MASRNYFDLPDLCMVGLEDDIMTPDLDFNETSTNHRSSSGLPEFQEFAKMSENEIFFEAMTTAPPGFRRVTQTQSVEDADGISLKKKDDFYDYNAWNPLKSNFSFGKATSTFEEKQQVSSSLTKNYGLTKNNGTLEGPSRMMMAAPIGIDNDLRLNKKIITFSPQDIIVYPLNSVYKEGIEMVHVIQAVSGKNLPPAHYFKVTLRQPDGWIKTMTLDSDNVHQDLYFCRFKPSNMGGHLLSVTLTTDGTLRRHVNSSPMDINVSRDYFRINRWFVMKKLPQKPEGLPMPWGVDVYRPTNRIYVADRPGNEILELDIHGRILNKFGHGQLNKPAGVAVDVVNMRVIVTDKDNDRVCVYSLNGEFQMCFGGKGDGDGQLKYPWGIAVSPDGETIAVVDSLHRRIQLFDKDGQYVRKYSVIERRVFDFKKEFAQPRGITFDHEGQNMYVTDFDLHAIFKINLDCTKQMTVLGTGKLWRPQGITMDAAGNLLVADSKHNCIQVVSLKTGQIVSVRKTGNVPFEGPYDVAVCNGGKVAVVDKSGTFRIF